MEKEFCSFCGEPFDPSEKGDCIRACLKDMKEEFMDCFSHFKKEREKQGLANTDCPKASPELPLELTKRTLVDSKPIKIVKPVKMAIPPEREAMLRQATEKKKEKKKTRKILKSNKERPSFSYDADRHPRYGFHKGTRAYNVAMDLVKGASMSDMIEKNASTKNSIVNVFSVLRREFGEVIIKVNGVWMFASDKKNKK